MDDDILVFARSSRGFMPSGSPYVLPARAVLDSAGSAFQKAYRSSVIRAELCFATPRKLPKPAEVRGRVVVLDVAFASEASGSGFDKITLPFINGLGSRLAMWVDHHDHERHADYAQDPRFVLSTKAEHGACPEMVTEEVVRRAGTIDTIVCHTDFDGLASAAKWLREGIEPYAGCDDDARAVDTRIGTPGPVGIRIDRAIRARGRDQALMGLIVRHLSTGLADRGLWEPIDRAAAELAGQEAATREIATRYRIVAIAPEGKLGGSPSNLAFVDATPSHGRYDKTALLLDGQKRASIAVVVDKDTLTLAAPFDSGVSFLRALGLSGGMPTLVSVQRTRLPEVLALLGVTNADSSAIGS